MKNTFVILFLLWTKLFFSQTAEQLFAQANALYQKEKYEQAIELYEQIEAKGEVSTELYYNLGNCYYKLNKVAPTIYHYEKALQIEPSNKEVLNNLSFAKRLTLDRIEQIPKTFLQKLEKIFLQKLSYDTWAIIAVVFSLLGTILFLLFYFSLNPSKKRLYFTTSILSFLLLLATLSIAFHQYNFDKSSKFAIIFSQKVDVKSAPTPNAEEIFSLHEGTKVQLLDAVDNWKKIKLADGKVGWIVANTLKEL